MEGRLLEIIEVEGRGVDWQRCRLAELSNDGLQSCDFAHKEPVLVNKGLSHHFYL